MITNTLKNVEVPENGDKTFSLDELREVSDIIPLTDNCWLCIHKMDELQVEFLLCQFSSSNIDDTNVRVSTIFEGCGPSGNLRELRHIHWGPDGGGYTFYLPGNAVIEALEKLKTYFDFD